MKPMLRKAALPGLELLAIVIWAIIVTRPYLNLDPNFVPAGREYLHHIHAHHMWTRFQECGLCALWNGSVRGGYPAFADVQESMLHPLIIVPTLLWGVVNGSKLALFGAFLIAGIGQWWLGRLYQLGSVARVWTACMAIAGGHLAGRMEHGIFGLVIAVSASFLVLPSIVLLSRSGSRRAVVVLGMTLALFFLAGQGYVQIGLLFALPAVLILIIGNKKPAAVLARRFLGAIGLALLFAAPFLLPMLHFFPQLAKNVDAAFGSVQPLAFIPLNLVINDWKYYNTEVMQKLPYPWLYVYFIGWLPVLLALWGLGGARTRQEMRERLFLSGYIVLVIWSASGGVLIWLNRTIHLTVLNDLIAGIRYPTLFTALAVEPILVLAGLGFDRLLSIQWLRFRLTPEVNSDARAWPLDLRWLLVIPLLFALSTTYSFNRQWIASTKLDPGMTSILESLRTPDLQWVNTPFGEQFWIEPAVALGLKIGVGTQGWSWRNRAAPEPMLEAARGGPPEGMVQAAVVQQLPIYKANSGREYATVVHADGSRTVCEAHGIGGDIDVACESERPGRLTIKENSWQGWHVSLDGQPVQLLSGQWLTIDLSSGRHQVLFRYRPWDVLLGCALAVIGIVLACFLWARDGRVRSTSWPRGDGDSR